MPSRSAQQARQSGIGSAEALYAHALAIEHEAVARYVELAQRMRDLGNDELAALFSRLAEFESEHAFRLANETAGLDLPKLDPAAYAWLDSGAPVPEARALVFRLMTARDALGIALGAEERAKAFFERILAGAADEGLRALAAQLAEEEESHIAWVKDALERLPAPWEPTEAAPGHPGIASEL
jgi:rubrerythrin